MTPFEFLVGIAKTVIWMGAYAQLLGMPVAWLRLRKTPAWRDRPKELRRIDLLAKFIVGPTVLTIIWGWLGLTVAALGGLGLSGGALLVVICGGPAIFVPWLVLRLDASRFPRIVEESRRTREAKRANY
jgi:hypothetical protein